MTTQGPQNGSGESTFQSAHGEPVEPRTTATPPAAIVPQLGASATERRRSDGSTEPAEVVPNEQPEEATVQSPKR